MIHLRFYQDADTSEEDYADDLHALCKREGHSAKLPTDWDVYEEIKANAGGHAEWRNSFSSQCLAAVTDEWQNTHQIGRKVGSKNYRGIGSALALHLQHGRVVRRRGLFLDAIGRKSACSEWRRP